MYMQNLMFGVEFKNESAKNLFQNLEEQEQNELSVRQQIEELKRNPAALEAWALIEKQKSRNQQLMRMGLHPIV